jgi:hypothetical protein
MSFCCLFPNSGVVIVPQLSALFNILFLNIGSWRCCEELLWGDVWWSCSTEATGWLCALHMHRVCWVCSSRLCYSCSELQWHGPWSASRQGEPVKDTGPAPFAPCDVALKPGSLIWSHRPGQQSLLSSLCGLRDRLSRRGSVIVVEESLSFWLFY